MRLRKLRSVYYIDDRLESLVAGGHRLELIQYVAKVFNTLLGSLLSSARWVFFIFRCRKRKTADEAWIRILL